MLWKNYIQIFSLWAVSSRKFRGLSLTSQDVGTVLAVSGVFCFSKFYANDNWIWETQSNYYINSTHIYHFLLAFSLNYLADNNFICFFRFWCSCISTCNLSFPCQVFWTNQAISSCGGMRQMHLRVVCFCTLL